MARRLVLHVEEDDSEDILVLREIGLDQEFNLDQIERVGITLLDESGKAVFEDENDVDLDEDDDEAGAEEEEASTADATGEPSGETTEEDTPTTAGTEGADAAQA